MITVELVYEDKDSGVAIYRSSIGRIAIFYPQDRHTTNTEANKSGLKCFKIHPKEPSDETR